jgi:hypothetical protein
MKGIQFWGALTSLYPRWMRGELPKQVHIFRALGGPLGSLILLLTGLLALATYSAGSAAGWVLAFLFLDNLLVLTWAHFYSWVH